MAGFGRRQLLLQSNILFATLALLALWLLMKKEKPHKTSRIESFGVRRSTETCPDYAHYSKFRHLPLSKGPLQLPYMRPPRKCRTFSSRAVEKLIADLMSKVKSDDMARLIENCLPNTLDTTILWHVAKEDGPKIAASQTFVVTGDIHAEWLRDAARQLSVYQPLMKHDRQLQELIKGAIRTQSTYIAAARYCNAFHPPPELGVEPGKLAKDDVNPRPDWTHVFECKYEIDSLASFLTLTNEYIEHLGGDLLVIDSEWKTAFNRLLFTLAEQTTPSFDPTTGMPFAPRYLFQRETNIGSETLPLSGAGNPVNSGTGLIRSAFRPSDDATILQFFIPGNIHMLTELRRIKKAVLEPLEMESQIKSTSNFISNIASGIEKYGIVNHPVYGKVYAYEVDGFGGNIFMDDANVPSLLSIPDLGYVTADDPVYQNTRRMVLEKSGNPYYIIGQDFEGIGGPHIGVRNAWPMSLLLRIRTLTDDAEITRMLQMLLETTGSKGLMHELINVHIPHGYEFTRSWFAWCNSEFGKTILWIAKNKPHIIFKEEYSKRPYDIDKVLQASSRL